MNDFVFNPDLDCAAGQYGQNCEHRCHCANSDPCPNFTGYCSHGCVANWAGSSCDHCADGWIGDNCAQSKM